LQPPDGARSYVSKSVLLVRDSGDCEKTLSVRREIVLAEKITRLSYPAETISLLTDNFLLQRHSLYFCKINTQWFLFLTTTKTKALV